MQDPVYEVNPDASLHVRLVGHERHKVLIFDNFAIDTAPLRAHACRDSRYDEVSSQYPGVRAPLPNSYTQRTLDVLYRRLFRTYRVPRNLGMKVVNAAYSLISVPEEQLEPPQRNPHFDTVNPYYLAILHYLNEGPFCDTGLFRHRATGFESLSEERKDAYADARQAHWERHGPPPRRYVNDSTDQYELYERIEYRPNRLVVYPGRLIHSGLVDPAVDINPDPRTGRLTANIFVDFLPADGDES